jgi:hypothetical protein
MKMSEFTEYSFNSYSLSQIAHPLFFTGIIILILSFSGTAAAKGGPKATVEQLKTEIADRRAADAVLQDSINNISLTPGPQGIQGEQGVAGNDGAVGSQGLQGVAGTNGTNGVDGTDSAGPIVDTRSPDIDDDMNDGFSVGTLWVDTTGGAAYIMTDNAPGSAIWKLITIAPASFVCSDAKPIDSLSMIWNGPNGVDVTSHTGATARNVQIGDEVTFNGQSGRGNDVFWDISGAISGSSKFHVSCSDQDMNGPEDSGAALGDGRDNDGGYINLWLFEGMKGINGVGLDCSALP